MAWQDYLDREQDRFIEELLDFIRIPSVSAMNAHQVDVRRAGSWVVDRLRAAGAENIRLLETGGHPVVYADWLRAGEDKPTVLIYGHFDVQPAEPLDQWKSPPFEPVKRDGRIYGRGSSDDKGGMLIPILSAEALLKETGKLPVNVKFFFEGQEEIGSPELPDFVAANADLLRADMIFSSDGFQWSETEPQLVNGLKGLYGCEVTVSVADVDMHSGIHGAAVANPVEGLAHVISSMKSLDGRVTVDGFYDDVIDLTDADREAIARVPFDEAAYLAETGASALHGEPGYTTRERQWGRPTLDLNGIGGGWQGDGSKTVLPAKAMAKITCRLVADQNPERIHELICAHVAAHTPAGLQSEVKSLPGRADPFKVPEGHNASAAAAQVLEEVYGVKPYQTRVGGSIPVMSTMLDVLGVHATMFAFGQDDEKQHAPNEFFRLSNFRRGQEAYCRLLERLGE